MPIYKVNLSLDVTMVVVAEDESHACQVAKENASRAIDEDTDGPDFFVRGEVTSEKQLNDGWDGECVPYGGDGNTRLNALLKKAN